MDGLSILHKYNNFEINDIDILLDRKYWIKSRPYPIEIVTIEQYIAVMKKLHENKLIRNDYVNKSRTARTHICTGLVRCSKCGAKYFSFSIVNKKQNGLIYYYDYYKHVLSLKKEICNNKPKSIVVNKIDNIFESYFFFYYIIFNEDHSLIKETQEIIKHKTQTIESNIKAREQSIIKIQKQIDKLSNILGDVNDKDALIIVSKKITSLENELSNAIAENASYKIELETMLNKYNNTEMENNALNIKERIYNFFNKMNIEDKRNELLRITKNCLLFNNYLLIDSGALLFLFDIRKDNEFDVSLLENFDKDIIYNNCIANNSSRGNNQKHIYDIDLNKKWSRDIVKSYLSEKFGIEYDISKHTNLISFVYLKDIYNRMF
jgi:hypothetical protein